VLMARTPTPEGRAEPPKLFAKKTYEKTGEGGGAAANERNARILGFKASSSVRSLEKESRVQPLIAGRKRPVYSEIPIHSINP